MMKKGFVRRGLMLAAALMAMCVLFSSCSALTKEKTLYEKIVNQLQDMKTFEASAYVRYISNNKSNTYITHQQARSTGEYKIEVTAPENVAGNVTIFDGKVISQFNKNIEGKISVGTTESMERSEILLISFIKNYFSAQDAAVSVSKVANADETMLEAKIPGDHRYMAMERLWVNNETLKPVELIIYDEDGVERIIVNYESFEYNVKLEDSVFVIQK